MDIIAKIKQKSKSSKGLSDIISLMFVWIMILIILMTIVDVGIWFSNRTAVIDAAQDGARLAAVFGGVDENEISSQYGVQDKMPTVCSQNGAKNRVECAVILALAANKQTTNTKITKIECGPGRTSGIGDRTYCEVHYRYNGVPMSGLSFIHLSRDNVVRVSSGTEVVHK